MSCRRPPQVAEYPLVVMPMRQLVVKHRVRAFTVAVILALWTCHTARGVSDESASMTILTLLERLMEADRNADVEAISSFYARDAILMPPTGPIVRGRSTIRNRYEEGFKRFRLDVQCESEELRVVGTWAFSRGRTYGRFIWLDGTGPTPFADKYLMILKESEPGVWEIHTLMWNPEGPGR